MKDIFILLSELGYYFIRPLPGCLIFILCILCAISIFVIGGGK